TCPLTDTSLGYSVHHDPFVYFDDVTTNQSSTSPTCLAHVRPYTELAPDLAHNTVARYNFITPNNCDNMQEPCTSSDTVKQGDNWLSTEVPTILNSQAYQNGGALFITWDEGANGSDGPLGLVVLS